LTEHDLKILQIEENIKKRQEEMEKRK